MDFPSHRLAVFFMNTDLPIPHLFRTEYRKIVAVLCKRFGFDQIATAEDIASETFLTAAQTWGVEGVPANPVAWLYQVAKYKAINHFKRHLHFHHTIAPQLQRTASHWEETLIDLSPQNITDSQLQMMFVVCHPALPPEAQIGLSLRILCGFGIEEIASAFLTNKETINKRLFRAKEKLREEKAILELPGPAALEQRLASVLATIYLLFNEGYYSIHQSSMLRKELCLEAIRLCSMLLENDTTRQPPVNALMALMCFHFSRFDARLDQQGEPVLYEEQGADRWNTDWISKGAYFLQQAATGDQLTKYHLEAGIAMWHTQKEDTREKWEKILQLYNQLLLLHYSPIAALNRTYALSKVIGSAAAIREAEELALTQNLFYCWLLGELYTAIDTEKARQHYQQALALAKTTGDQQAILKKLQKL